MKKIVALFIILILSSSVARADFAQHYDAAQNYLTNYQYSSAIDEFKKALRINYLDNSARVGLVNSYLARGTYYANNERNWEAAANDYRAALFYLRYYATAQDVQNSTQAITNATRNLNQCFDIQKFNINPQSRYKKAVDLRLEGQFAEAGYEFAQSIADSSLREKSFEQIADIMKVLGNDPKAVEYYQKAVALNKDDAGVRLKYARVLDKLGQNEVAVQEYNYALSKCENDPEIIYALERIYRQKLQETPNDASAIANLGAILQKQGKLDEALQYYMKAGQIDPSNVTTRLNVGTLYQQKKSYDSAIAAYDSILVLYPNNVDANFYRAQCLVSLGDKSAAMEGFKKVLALEPTNKDVKTQIFEMQKANMSSADYVAYLAREAALDRSAIDTMYEYAIELHKRKKYDEAIYGYKEVLKFNSNDPEIYLNIAIAYREKGDIASSKSVLSTAKMKFPTNASIATTLKDLDAEVLSGALNNAADSYNSGNFQKSLESYMSIQPATYDSLCGVAASYKGLENDNQAIEYYKKAFALKQDSEIAYYIGVLYSEKEDWMNAKTYLKKAMTIDTNNTKAKDLYWTVVEQSHVKLVEDAIALYDKANYEQSLKIVNQILSENSKNAYALYYRGLIYDVQKKYALAIADYKKAIQNNSELKIVNYLIALDYDTLAQYANALAYYKKYVAATVETNEFKTYSQSRIKELANYGTKK